MKKLSVLLVMLLLATGALLADISLYYTFAPSTGTYTAITGTAVPTAIGDDVISDPIDIGFSFVYGLNAYTQVKISSNGYVTLGTTPGSTLGNALASTSYCPVVAPLWDDTEIPATGSAQYLLTGTAPNRIFTVQYTGVEWNYSATNSNNYQVKLYETGKVELVYGTSTGVASGSASIGINMLPGGASNYWSVTPGATATASNTAENNTIAAWPGEGTIYAFNPPVAMPNDMAALSITGNTTPTVGQASVYTVGIRNMGTSNQAAGAYTVKLMNGTTELGSVAGPAIVAGATADVQVSWTPAATGPVPLTGKVVLANDGNAANDMTAVLNVTVQAAGTIVVTVGAGDQQAQMPINFYWMNSLYETIILGTEINQGGAITGLTYYNNFVSNLSNKPINIWLGETTQTDLTAGWIPSTQLTQVFAGTVNFPSGANTILIPLPTPFAYGGGNLVMMFERVMDTEYFSNQDFFQCQTVGTNRALNIYSDGTDYDPANPPTGATLTGQFPKTSISFIVGGMGVLHGTVTAGGTGLEGVTVAVNNTALTQTTNATGVFNFPFVTPGQYTVTFSKLGYATQTLPAVIVADQTTTVNVVLVPLPIVNVTGTVLGSDTATGLEGANISLTGVMDYSGVSNAQGQFTITGVLSGNTYAYTITKVGYTTATGNIVVGATNYAMGNITLNEISLPAAGVQAAENAGHTMVNVTWMAPGTAGGEWLSYDGENDDSIGTGGVADFDVAIRFPASALQDYVGMSLYTLNLWPAQAGTFSARVWTGGTATAPGAMVVDQAFTPVLDQYNAVTLATPVPITGTEELWFGYRCNVTSGYPAGCDAGPAIDGFGNMMFWQGAWTTLLALAPSLNYNWNIQGYVGYSAPTRIAPLQPLTFNADRINTGTLALSGRINKLQSAPLNDNVYDVRTLQGYRVYRLLVGQETNEAAWTTLTPNTITATAYSDGSWANATDGQYKWAVKAVYTNNVMSVPAFSNMVQKLTQIGTIAGIVRTTDNTPISGATVTAMTYTATTNASGAYSMQVPAGTYTVTAAAAGYVDGQQNGVVVVTGVTTTVNFNLEASANIIEEGFEGTTFPPTGWTQIITETGAANTYGVTPTWCRVGNVAIDPAATPPEGTYQAGLWWSYNHQDEWLITPEFECPGTPTLSFKSYVFYGSTYNDHYYVKISSDNGNNWEVLWDASTMTGGQQVYGDPIVINIPANYVGQNVKIAFHAIDPSATQDGIWYQWFIDQVIVTGTTATDDPTPAVATTALYGCYPNPFNPNTTISYSVKASTPVVVEIYNVKGQKVKTLVNETKAQGTHQINWNGTDDNGTKVTSGVYFYKMNAGKFSSSKKMILMK